MTTGGGWGGEGAYNDAKYSTGKAGSIPDNTAKAHRMSLHVIYLTNYKISRYCHVDTVNIRPSLLVQYSKGRLTWVPWSL